MNIVSSDLNSNNFTFKVNSVDAIKVATNGNVGIWTTTPSTTFDVSGAVKFRGALDMTSQKITNVALPTTTTDVATKSYVDGAIPIGGIIMWSGSIATIPSNWRLCNGTNGTPDLGNRFVIGATLDVTGQAQTNIEGSNTQTGGTKDAVVVAHNHTVVETPSGEKITTGLVNNGGGGNFQYPSLQGDINAKYNFTTALNHTHSVTVNSEGVSGTNQNLPPYYALAFIMRIS